MREEGAVQPPGSRPSSAASGSTRRAELHRLLEFAVHDTGLPAEYLTPWSRVALSSPVRGMDIGGDFYDLVRVDDITAAAFIGDVQGHNVTAAALMGRVRSFLRSYAATGTTPAQALAHADRQLVDLDQGRFVSCLYAHLDLAHRRAVLATAGHPPPVLRHPDGHAEVLALPPGLLLGIDPDTDYPATEIPLTPGTVLALYTDGLVETPGVDPDDAMSGLADQLAQARFQPTDRLATALIDHARRTAPMTDDIALLLIGLTTTGQDGP